MSKKTIFETGQRVGEKNFKTPKCVLSFPHLFEPDSFEGGPPKFQCDLIFDDSEVDLSLMKKIAQNTIREKYGEKKISKFRLPFRDGEEYEGKAGYGEGKTFIKVKSKNAPMLIDRKGMPITNESDLYAGCIVRAIVAPFTYETPSKGLSFALLGVQKLRDGDSLGGGISANAFGEDDMSAFEQEDDANAEDLANFGFME